MTLPSWELICVQHPAVSWAFSATQAFQLRDAERNRDLTLGRCFGIPMLLPQSYRSSSKLERAWQASFPIGMLFAHELKLIRYILQDKVQAQNLYSTDIISPVILRRLGLDSLWLSSGFVTALVLAGVIYTNLCNAMLWICDQSSAGNSLMISLLLSSARQCPGFSVSHNTPPARSCQGHSRTDDSKQKSHTT